MRPTLYVVSSLALVLAPLGAQAGEKKEVQPVQLEEETVRYNQGVATVDLRGKDGAVQVTPLEMDHGSYAFGIGVYNLSGQPAEIDVSDFTMEMNGVTVAPFTRKQLEKQAASRAAWASFAVALAGGLSAYAAASQQNHYRTTLITPRGTYQAFSTGPNIGGQVAASAIVAGTGITLASIQNRLDETRQALGDQIVQRTTLDPGESYAGKVILAKMKRNSSQVPQPMTIMVHFNGEDYRFGFQLANEGTRPPEFKKLPAVEVSPAVPPVSAPVESKEEVKSATEPAPTAMN